MPALTREAERHDPGWWTPARIPLEMRQFETGKRAPHGAVGLLDLELARLAGATRLVRHFHRTPLYVLRPIYLDQARPGMAFVYLQQQGGGLLQGDRHRMDVDVGQNAEVHITTQGATKIYGMDDGYATQLVNLSAAAGSLLEYLPEPVIPFRRSRFFGETTVTADPDATVLFAETLLPGRVARGEWHDYDVYCSTTRIRRPDGEQIAQDSLAFGAGAGRADSPARLGAQGVHAAFFVLAAPERTHGLAGKLLEQVGERQDLLAGVSTLPSDAGLLVRVLGPSSIPVKLAVQSLWDTARRHLTGSPAPDLRKD